VRRRPQRQGPLRVLGHEVGQQRAERDGREHERAHTGESSRPTAIETPTRKAIP
jgi:hypothetical protein